MLSLAMYCIGNFGLMLISLLETIIVMYLMKKDSHPKPMETTGCLSDEGRDHNMFRDIFDKGKRLFKPILFLPKS